MRYTNRLSVVTAAIAGGATAMLLVFGGRSSDATICAPAPSIPPDCYVADEPTENGPAAPSNLELTFRLPSFYVAYFELEWDHNSEDETCFVVERREPGYITNVFEIIAVLPANTSAYSDGPFGHGDSMYYRVYAATSTARSEYSNEEFAGIPIYEPTPTPLPPSWLRGDLNCDHSIDPRDSLALLRVDSGLSFNYPFGCPKFHPFVSPVPDQGFPFFPRFRRADMDCNGNVDPLDSLAILREDAGLDLNLPDECWPLDILIRW